LAVDDAASGYSSLRQILLLEPDIIKLDISITQGLEHDKRRRALAASLVSFAREMEASVVGEGIETPTQVQILTELGVHHGQGFHIARPQSLPLENSDAWRFEAPAGSLTAPPTEQIRLA
jgi:EAL domain-containing protein (putative c-di-GMP-specific phosphodiesterase class I)